jgi:hypothetical protein
MIPELSMLFRRQMRIAVVSALQKADLWVDDEPVSINSPGNWSLQHLKDECGLPAILVRTGTEGKLQPFEQVCRNSTHLFRLKLCVL